MSSVSLKLESSAPVSYGYMLHVFLFCFFDVSLDCKLDLVDSMIKDTCIDYKSTILIF